MNAQTPHYGIPDKDEHRASPPVEDYGGYTQRAREQTLRPLADSIALMVRGVENVRIEHTGGNLWSVVAQYGVWTLYADEEGWSVSDDTGDGIHNGTWHDDGYVLTPDDDTGALVPDECDGAAVNLAAALTRAMGGN